MILDRDLLFSDAQAETTIATHVSTYDVDIAEPGDAEKELHFVAKVNDTVTSGGAATVQVQLITDDDVAFGSPVTVFDSGEIALADLVSGYQFFLHRLPKNVMQRYSRVLIIIGTAVLTAGSIDAFFAMDVDNPLV